VTGSPSSLFGRPCGPGRGLRGRGDRGRRRDPYDERVDHAEPSSNDASILALDVDGVLLDPERAGDGHWTNELSRRYGITRRQLRDAFFMQSWDDVVNGRRDLGDALDEALATIGAEATVDEVIDCWFAADFVPITAAVELARRVGAAGRRVVLATNQEHRRAAYLSERFGHHFPVTDVIYSAQLGVQKHDAAFFSKATERLGATTHPAQVLFVDDVALNVEQADRAGWTALLADADGQWIGRVERLLLPSEMAPDRA
jgi:putative hydrolase of the HAD superfamily